MDAKIAQLKEELSAIKEEVAWTSLRLFGFVTNEIPLEQTITHFVTNLNKLSYKRTD